MVSTFPSVNPSDIENWWRYLLSHNIDRMLYVGFQDRRDVGWWSGLLVGLSVLLMEDVGEKEISGSDRPRKDRQRNKVHFKTSKRKYTTDRDGPRGSLDHV